MTRDTWDYLRELVKKRDVQLDAHLAAKHISKDEVIAIFDEKKKIDVAREELSDYRQLAMFGEPTKEGSNAEEEPVPHPAN